MDNDLAYTIIGCALKVHAKLGPGLLESVYQKALMIELDNECLLAEEEVPINVIYEGNINMRWTSMPVLWFIPTSGMQVLQLHI